jgi:hypothetical protein
MWRRMRTFPSTICWRSGTSSPPLMTSSTMARLASFHRQPRMGMRSGTSLVCQTW